VTSGIGRVENQKEALARLQVSHMEGGGAVVAHIPAHSSNY